MDTQTGVSLDEEMDQVEREVDALQRRTQELLVECERRAQTTLDGVSRWVETPRKIGAAIGRHRFVAAGVLLGLLGAVISFGVVRARGRRR